MRSEDRILELLSHADSAVVAQGVELAWSLSGRQQLAVIARLLQRDDPWLCFAAVTTDPDPHTRLFLAWCARNVLPLCAARGVDCAVLEATVASVEADPRVVFDSEDNAEFRSLREANRGEDMWMLFRFFDWLLRPEVLGIRKSGRDLVRLAARLAADAAETEAEAHAEAVRDGILARSRDPQVAENLYAETRKDSQLRIETAEQEARLLQRTELYRRCKGLIR